MQDNELIARFMGMKPKQEKDLDGWWTNNMPVHPCESIIFDAIKFDKCWNWLMPVIRKIVTDEEEIYIGNEYRENVMDIVPFANITDTYNAVVNFIKWYNNENR